MVKLIKWEGKKLLHINNKLETFGYIFSANHQNEVIGLHALGWEKQTESTYNLNGQQRNETNRCVFQYTLSGQGKIEVEGKEYTLQPGDAFLVQIPSDHRYYLPETSDSWEFLFITTFGKQAEKVFQFVHEKVGPVVYIHPESPLIQLLMEIYEKALKQNINDAYHASAVSFSFIMELYRFILSMDKKEEMWPESVVKAILFIKNNYNQNIGLEDIIEVAELSKYHFTRLFQKTTNYTPLQYITKVRLDRAIVLLKSTDLTVAEIARQVGYANGNYFTKVFQKKIGQSPGQFRNNRFTAPVNHLITD